MRGGTAQTELAVRRMGKPCLVLALDRSVKELVGEIHRWVAVEHIRVLNVAGPRESQAPGIYRRAYEVLAALFGSLAERSDG